MTHPIECIKCCAVIAESNDVLKCNTCNGLLHAKCIFSMLQNENRSQNMPKYFTSVFTIPNVILYCSPCLELSNSINTNNVLNKITINELDRNDETPVNHIDASIFSDTNNTNIISYTSKIELLYTQMNIYLHYLI